MLFIYIFLIVDFIYIYTCQYKMFGHILTQMSLNVDLKLKENQWEPNNTVIVYSEWSVLRNNFPQPFAVETWKD